MKKLIIFFSALALISSCAKIEVNEPDQNDQTNDSAVLYADLPEVLYASVSDESGDEQTRTYVDDKSVKWHMGESISYYAGTYANVKYTMQVGQYDGTVNAKFVKNGDAKYNFGGDNVYNKIPTYPLAIYPYRESHLAVFGNNNSSRYNFSVNYAKEQTYAPNSFGKGADIMVATGSSNDDENLYFRHACGYLVIKLYGADTKVSNITLTALGEGVKISGEATLRVEQNEPVQFNAFKNDEAYNTISLNCFYKGQGVELGADAENATEFWFALPPVQIKGGIKIVVTDVNGATFTKQTTKDINITRNNVQPMAALQFVAQTPPLNKIWYTKTAEAMAEEGGENPITFGTEEGQPFDATIKENGHYYDESTGKFVIEFNTHVKIIKAKAFYDTDIQTIELPHSLETIEEKAFAYSKISAITIPGSVNRIKTEAFNGCCLKSIEFLPSPNTTPLTIESDNDRSPFYHSAAFTSIYLNREIAYVNPDGTTFTADKSHKGLFVNHFPPNQSVSVTLGDQVRTILNNMFTSVKIEHITIPGTVMEIKDDAFSSCLQLSSIRFEASTNPLTIGFHPAPTSIGNECGPFYHSPLTSIYVNRELVASTSYAAARDQPDEGIFSTSFDDAEVKVTLQGNVKTISDYMFSGVNMQTIWIPREVELIGKSAFEDCSKLYGVTLAHSTPPALGVDAFDGTLLQKEGVTRWIALENATNINSFKTATNWSEYANIIMPQYNSTAH